MAKSRTAIVVDSTAYIPQPLIEKSKIHVIPQILQLEGESLLDGVDITPEDFYQRLKTSSVLPTTSQPSAGEFADFFEHIGRGADGIVAILISNELSGTINSARAAKDLYKDVPIEIIDSRSTTMGLGFIALAAAHAAEQGMELDDVARLARSLVPKARTFFVVDTLEFLHRGGRIGGAQRLIGSMLSVKPLLHLFNGRIEPLSSVRTKKRAIAQMLDIVEDEIREANEVKIATFNALASEETELIMEQLRTRFELSEILQTQLSPVIGTHVGPGTVGIALLVTE